MQPNITQSTPSNKEVSYSAYDLFILFLTIFSLIGLIILAFPNIGTSIKSVLFFFDTVVSLIFLADFFHSFYHAPGKMAYLKWGWLDFLGSLPLLPEIRVLRLARLIRIVRMMRRIGAKQLLATIIVRRAESAFWLTALVTILFLGLASSTILNIEAVSADANIVTASDAVWWAFVTVTTVGYGDKFPTTDIGRLLATILMVVGISLYSVLTSFLTTAFRSQRERAQTNELNQIRSELEQIKRLLQEREKLSTE